MIATNLTTTSLRRRVATTGAAVLLLSIAAGACSSGGSETSSGASGGSTSTLVPSSAVPPGTDRPGGSGATPTTASALASVSPVPTWPAATTPCGFVARQFSVWNGLTGESGTGSEAEQKAQLEAAAAASPPEIRDHLTLMLRVFDDQQPGREDAGKIIDAIDAALEWAVDSCPEGAPYWSCSTPRRRFVNVGSAIDDSGPPPTTAPPATGPTPEAALSRLSSYESPSEPRELVRSDTAVLFVSYDDAAPDRVDARVLIEGAADGIWTAGPTFSC